jgi:hypothetical protein
MFLAKADTVIGEEGVPLLFPVSAGNHCRASPQYQ